MVIVLGSTSIEKKKLLEQFLKQKVETVLADSEINHQPLSESETELGAINRAKNALKLKPNCEMSIGMEGGLEKVNGIYYLVCVVAVIQSNGTIKIGTSQKRRLPELVSKQIDEGKLFGELIREFENKNKTPEINELVTRKESFLEALKQVFS